MMPTSGGDRPRTMLDELIPIGQARLDLFQKAIRGGDHHVVDLIVNPYFTHVAWTYNFPYPEGKPKGWGLIGGRTETFHGVSIPQFVSELDPVIRPQYATLLQKSGNQWTEPPECTAVREAYEEFKVRIRFLTWLEEISLPGGKTTRVPTHCKEGIVQNPDREIGGIMRCLALLKGRLKREPTASEITTNLEWWAGREPASAGRRASLERWLQIRKSLTETLGREPAPEEARTEIFQKNEEGFSPYLRTIFFCIAMNPGDPATQARSPEGPLQTREARWFPLDEPPVIESEEEAVERKRKGTPAPDPAYFTHVQLVRDPDIRRLIEQIEAEPDIGAKPGEDAATLRYLWKNIIP